MKNKLFFTFFLLFFPFFLECQSFGDGSRLTINKSGIISEEITDEFPDLKLFPIGSNNKELNYIFKEIFDDKDFQEIKQFLIELPINNKSLVIQKIVHKILTSDFLMSNVKLSKEQDLELFTIKINKLFQTARFSDIDQIYSKAPLNFIDENFNLKRIEGYFLRNEYKNACDLLNQDTFVKSYVFGKFEIICNIIEQNFEKARFNLSLLKEKNEPGDNLFIDLCYSIIGDLKISKSKVLTDNKKEIASLNPILLSSLQLAEISPKFEHVKNASPSILTFILLSPSSDVDIKLYTAELLVKQERIDKSMLADIYQLSSYSNEELENAINDYKKLSPLQSRSLLYQALIRENSNDIKFELAKILLNQSEKDELFTQVAYLIKDSIDYKSLQNISEKDIGLIFKIYLSVQKFNEAEIYINTIDTSENYKKYSLYLNLFKFLDNNVYFDKKILNDYFDSRNDDYLTNKENIFLTIFSSFIFNNDSELSNILINTNNENEVTINSLNIVSLINAIEKKSYFNSFRVIFKTMKDKNISDLNIFEKLLLTKVLFKLEMNNEFKIFSKDILLSIL